MKPLVLKTPVGLVRVFPHAIEGYVDAPVTVGGIQVMGSNLMMMSGDLRAVLNTPEQIDAMLGLKPPAPEPEPDEDDQ
jgi:hypothetical protein